MVLNLVPMLFLILMGSFLMERKLKKGVESHESLSGKNGNKKGKKQEQQGRSIKSVIESHLKMLRRQQ